MCSTYTDTILKSTIHTIGMVYVTIITRYKIFTLTSYNFCILPNSDSKIQNINLQHDL